MTDIRSKIPYVDLGEQYRQEKNELLPLIDKVFQSGNYILGDEVNKLENNIKSFVGTKHCITLNSGTDALLLGLHCLGVKSGDEVITQPNSFIASAATIAHLGAKPVFVDVMDDQSINPEKIKSAITNKTKAIMPVHLTGRIGEFTSITEIAKEHNIPIIEDAAQSIGSIYKNKQAGSLGDVGCFSTHPLKNLNAMGDGGFLTTNSDQINEICRLYRNHGLETRENCKFWGTVSRLDEIQACILNYRFKSIEKFIEGRIRNANLYMELLDKNFVYFPSNRDYAKDTFHTFVIQIDKRDKLKEYLFKNGINTSIHYPRPIHLQTSSKYLKYKKGDFPNTENQSERILTLPINNFVSKEEVFFICEKINKFFN